MPLSRVLGGRTRGGPRVPAYRPGQFRRRELPPLRTVLGEPGGLGPLVVDGYADLDPSGRPGSTCWRAPAHWCGEAPVR